MKQLPRAFRTQWCKPALFLALAVAALATTTAGWLRSLRCGDVIFTWSPRSHLAIASKGGRLQLAFFRRRMVPLPPHADFLVYVPTWGRESWPVHTGYSYRFDPDNFLIAQVPERIAEGGFAVRSGRDSLGLFSWCIIILPYWSLFLASATATALGSRPIIRSMAFSSRSRGFDVRSAQPGGPVIVGDGARRTK